MKRSVVFALSVFLIIGITGTIQAKDKENLPESDPLAIIIPGECSNVQIAPFGTSLLASWEWEVTEVNSGAQTKFGGDAVYEITASIDEGLNFEKFEVGFGLVQYEPDTPADAYPGELVYRCSNAQTEPSGTCNGSVLGLRSAIIAAAAEYFGVDQIQITDITADFQGVYVKAMNPGNKQGRQNYTLTNVCLEEEILQ